MRDSDISLKPRKYQIDALEYALRMQRSVCCLPTGTGKTLVGILWLQSLAKQGVINRALILEPTRLLVRQMALYYMEKGGVELQAIDGTISPDTRRVLWQKPFVVATPESAYNDKDWLNFDAVIVDECHHTVGNDAFAKLMDVIIAPYRLGLSATVPEKRRPEIVSYIGPMRQWSWSDPEIEQYMPDWIGDVYEAELSHTESQALELIRNISRRGFGLLERYLARDGSLALVETLSKHGKFAKEFGPLVLPALQGNSNRLHKLHALQRIIDDHDFTKAIIFVDRRVLATYLADLFREFDPVLLLGRKGTNQEHALQLAKAPETKMIIATSAGEEGIDLPEADLLVAWGSVESEIRFIQRHGRIMRKTGDQLKYATFIVTPGTSDYDSFVKGLERAQASGQINIEEAFGWETSILWPKTTWWHVTESLRGRGGYLNEIGEIWGIKEQMVSRVLQGAVKRGRIFYLYDVSSMAADITMGYLEWYATRPDMNPIADKLHTMVDEFGTNRDSLALARSLARLLASCSPEVAAALGERLRSKIGRLSTKSFIAGEKISQRRIYFLSEDAGRVAELRPNQVAPYERFSENPSANIVIQMRRKKNKKGIEKQFYGGKGRFFVNVIGENQEQFWESVIQKDWEKDTPGYTIGLRGPTLEYYFSQTSPQVFSATVRNMCGLLKWRDVLLVSLNKCSQCSGYGAWSCNSCNKMLCLNCWAADSGHGSIAEALEEFGSPMAV